MPRKRQGPPSQRTDQLGPPIPSVQPQPVRVATGQPYGAAGQQAQMQQQAPVPQAPTWDQAAQQARATPFQSLGLMGPSIRPHEPITTGIPLGAGAPNLAGPPMGASSTPVKSVSDTLSQLAQSEPSLAGLANLARQQGV